MRTDPGNGGVGNLCGFVTDYLETFRKLEFLSSVSILLSPTHVVVLLSLILRPNFCMQLEIPA